MKEDNQLVIRLEKRRPWKLKAFSAGVAVLFLIAGFGWFYLLGSDGSGAGALLGFSSGSSVGDGPGSGYHGSGSDSSTGTMADSASGGRGVGDILKDGVAAVVSSWNQLLSSGSAADSSSLLALDGSSDGFANGPDDGPGMAATGTSDGDDEEALGAPSYEAPPDDGATTDKDSAKTTGLTPKKTPPSLCLFAGVSASSSIFSRRLILNEIAWMGSLPQAGETSAKASEREWIELKNISGGALDISGWQILDAAGNIKTIVGDGIKISAGGFYLLARGVGDVSGATPDATYSGGLSNAGGELAVFDPACGISDFLDASAGWPAGDNSTKQTLERDADGIRWHTSVSPGGTPGAENSVPVLPVPVATSASMQPIAPLAASSSLLPSPSSTSSPKPAEQYLVSVSFTGEGVGVVSSSPSGILCGFDCSYDYSMGSALTFSEAPGPSSYFEGWSGPCVGVSKCGFTVTSSIHLVADFELLPVTPTMPAAAIQASSTPPDDADSSGASVDHLVIAQIQIGGASSSNDFVKLFNPTAAPVDVGGWKLHKRSSTGADYSLRDLPQGSSIAPGGYFTWANSLGGFSLAIGADVSSTETLSADNSVALFDAAGGVVDEVAWGTGTAQYVEGSPYPTDPAAGQSLLRKFAGGSIIDTNNNAADFSTQ